MSTRARILVGTRILIRGWRWSTACLLQAAENVTWRNIFQAAWPAVAFALLMLLPYLSKAFLMDDTWSMVQAEHVLRHPLEPTNFDICWFGREECGKAWSMASGQSLVAYLLIPAVLAGGAEWVAHVMELLFAVLAIVSMTAITMRLGWSRNYARLASCFLVAIPPFLPAASSAMADMPALGLGLFGLERLLAWKTYGHKLAALASALALGLAPFARPHFVALIGLAALLLMDHPGLAGLRELRQPARWAPVLGAILVFGGTVWLARQGGGGMAPPAKMEGHQFFWENLRAYLIYLAWPIPFAPLWLWCWRRQTSVRLIGLAVPVMCVAQLAGMKVAQAPVSGSFMVFAMMAALGAAGLIHAIYWTARQRNAQTAVLLLWMLIPAAAVFYIHMPIRYFAVSLPGCILLLLEATANLPRRHVTAMAAAVVAIGAIHSAAILYADNFAAEMARTAARRLVTPRVTAGQRIWWTGQWGLYWYARKAGALECWPGRSDPGHGDLLLAGDIEGYQHALDRFPHRTKVDSLAFSCRCGRTLPPFAGLYTNLPMPLPWSWGTGEVDRYEVWRIE